MKEIQEFLQEISTIYESGTTIDESRLHCLLSKWKKLLVCFSSSSKTLDRYRSLHHYKLDIEWIISTGKIKACTDEIRQLLLHQFVQYIKVELDIIEAQDEHITSSQMHWTGTKAQLVELIYALYVSGCVNEGQAKQKELIRVFSKLFNIDLKHFHSTLNNIINRKDDPDNEESRVLFLSRLIKQLKNRMIELDERV